MDYALITNTDYLLSSLWTWIMGSLPTLQYTNGTAGYIMPARIMGYAGAGITFLLSTTGAIIAGSAMVQKVEENFWSILDDF